MRIFMNSGLKPQKQTVFIAKSTKRQLLLMNSGMTTNILGVSGLELQSSSTKSVNSLGHNPRLGGTILVWGGTSSDLGDTAPRCLPVAPRL